MADVSLAASDDSPSIDNFSVATAISSPISGPAFPLRHISRQHGLGSMLTQTQHQTPTGDVECVWVNPRCGVQTIENRFGPCARSRIYASLHLFHDVDNGGMNEEDPDVADVDGTSTGEGGDGLVPNVYAHDGGVAGNDGDEFGNTAINGGSSDLDNDSNSQSDNDPFDLGESGEGADADLGDAEDEADTEGAMEVDLSSQSGSASGESNAGGVSSPPFLAGHSDNNHQDADIDYTSSHAGPLHGPAFPRVSRARLNLTALSQRFNLYFAVYQDKIHVFRPQSAPEILRGPELVLRPPPSGAAREIGGYIEPGMPHQVNQAKIGNLGKHEVLLLAYDDGDVVGYYTHHIAEHVESIWRCRRTKISRPVKVPKPFFTETVGKSAWGLAVHEQSRLIAVSSNLVEVIVFAFALKPADANESCQFKTEPLHVPEDDPSPLTCSGISALQLESRMRSRDRNWRILLPLSLQGGNIPSIDFLDDEHGNADKVVAVDIHGAAWILDIWKVGSRPIRIAPPSHRVGWGVMVLPAKAFLKTRKMPEVLQYSAHAGVIYSMSIAQDMSLVRQNDPLIGGWPFDPETTTISAHELEPYVSGMDERSDDTTYDSSSSESWSSESDDQAGNGDYDWENIMDVLGDSGSGSRKPDSLFEPQRRWQTRPGQGSVVNKGRNGASVGASKGKEKDNGEFCYKGRRCMDCMAFSNMAKREEAAKWCRRWEMLEKPDVLRSTSFPSEALDFLARGDGGGRDFHFGMMVCPNIGLTWSDLSQTALIGTLKNVKYRHARASHISLSRYKPRAELQKLSERCSILRTFGTSADLFSVSPCEPSVVFDDLMLKPSPKPHYLWDMTMDYSRLSLLHYVPEINLVVVGGMFGRVALLRPMRTSSLLPPSGKHADLVPRRSFRVEWILPRLPEEEKWLRPACCLLGLAVSPVPAAGGARHWRAQQQRPQHPQPSSSEKRQRHQHDQQQSTYEDDPSFLNQQSRCKLVPCRRWRLILHYMDHSILQYYIEEKKPGSGDVALRFMSE